MATIYTDYRNHTRFYLSWDVAQQDIANNRSLINWTTGVQAQSGWNPFWGSNAIRINSVYIDGQGNLASGTWSNISLVSNQTLPLRSGSIWVGHNGDGTKNISASVSGWFFQNGDVGSSGNLTAPTIPRNSQVTTDKTSYVLGEPISVYTNRKSGTFTHTITLRNQNASGTILKQFTNVADAATWTPDAGEITTMENLIPNSNVLSVYVEQWNNQISQGSNTTVPFNLADANPVFTDFTYRDSNETVVAITGDDQVLVKGQSILETKITSSNKMVAVKGSSPSQYGIVYDGVTVQIPYQSTGDVVGTITSVTTIGQRTLLVTATDSRTNNTSVAKQVMVYDYTAPTIESTILRENNFGTDTTIHLNGVWNPLVIGGSNKNALTIGSLKYRYREDAGGFGAWSARTFTVTGSEWEVTTDFVVSLDNTKKYIFEFQITDKFGTVTSTNSVDVGKPIMFVGELDGEPSIGIGKMPEDGALDVSGDIYSNGLKISTGGWSEIGRIVGTVDAIGTTLSFAAHKFIRVEIRSEQTGPPGATQYTLNLQFNSLTSGTSYNYGAQKLTSAGVAGAVTGDSAHITMAVSRGVRHQAYSQYEVVGYPTLSNVCIGKWNMVSEDPDYAYADGRCVVRASSALSSLKVFTSGISYDAEVIVYGHN